LVGTTEEKDPYSCLIINEILAAIPAHQGFLPSLIVQFKGIPETVLMIFLSGILSGACICRTRYHRDSGSRKGMHMIYEGYKPGKGKKSYGEG